MDIKNLNLVIFSADKHNASVILDSFEYSSNINIPPLHRDQTRKIKREISFIIKSSVFPKKSIGV